MALLARNAKLWHLQPSHSMPQEPNIPPGVWPASSDEVFAAGVESLFAEPFSEWTRKRQSAVLVSALVTFLVSFSIIVPPEVNLAGAKLIWTNQFGLRLALACATAYLDALFLLSWFQDTQLQKYRVKRFREAAMRFVTENLRSNLEHQLRVSVISDKLEQTNSRKRQRTAPAQARFYRVSLEQTHLYVWERAQWVKAPDTPPAADQGEIWMFLVIQGDRNTDESPDGSEADEVNALNEERQILSGRIRDVSAESTAVMHALGRFRRLHRIRSLLELVLPTLFAAAAIWSALVPWISDMILTID